MTIERWRKIDDRQRVEYLKQGEITVESKLVFEEPRMLGDVTAVSERYRAKVGPVILSRWKNNPINARMAAAGRIKALRNKVGFKRQTGNVKRETG